MQILDKFQQALQKFPVPMLFSIGLTCVLIIESFSRSTIEHQLVLALISAFFVSGALNLYFCARPTFHPVLENLFSFILGIVLFALAFFNQWSSANYIFLILGLFLLLTVAPYFALKAKEETVWLYNAQFLFAIKLGIIAALVFGGGVSAILVSTKFLFNITVPSVLYKIVWSIAVAFVGPFVTLSLIQLDFNKLFELPKNDSLLSRGVHILINFIFVPLLLVYIAVLHLYGVKILVTWSLPKGQVAVLVLCFSIGLIGFILFARPWYERLTKLARFLLTYWHYLLIAPAILLAIGVFRRISDYGFTPERYGLVLSAIWIILLIVMAIFKKGQVRNVSMIFPLVIMLLAASFGPWGATGFSLRDQTGRLISLLEEKQFLENGVLSNDKEKRLALTNEEIAQGRSVIHFLYTQDALYRIESLFAGLDVNPFQEKQRASYQLSNSLKEELGFLGASRNLIGKRVRYYAKVRRTFSKNFAINSNVSFLGNFRIASTAEEPKQKRADGVYVWHDGTILFISSDVSRWEIPFKEILLFIKEIKDEKERAESDFDFDNRSFAIRNTEGHRLTLILSSANFKEHENGSLEFRDIEFSAIAEWSKP